MMQLEELQQHWQRLDEKLDQSLKLEAELLRQVVLPPARRRVNRLAMGPAVDSGLCVCALLLAGSLLGNHWRDWPLVVPSAATLIAAIVLLIDSVRQLVCVSELDWSGPVAEIQCSLERLRGARIRQFKWAILLGPLVGFCLLIVGIQSLFDWFSGFSFSIADKLNHPWVLGNYAFGVLFIPLGYAIARMLAKRFHGHAWWQNALDGISGKSLKAAAQELERWTSLQRETSA